MKTWIYIDHFKGEVQPGSWEALGLGKTFGAASAIVFGSGVDAVVKGGRQLALQCLLLDPVITDLDVAQQVLDDYLLTYKEYLPSFWK